MCKRLFSHIKNLLLPVLCFSLVTGVFSALLVTAFKLGAEWIIHKSSFLYGAVRQEPLLLPCLLLGATVVGFVSSLILSFSRTCRGGGIPTSVAAIRGITSFKWLPSMLLLPFSALLTFFCGIPLGTEGPCVQMGTAVGDGVVHFFGRGKQKEWRRYIMTGGASAGFSLATGAPITSILFSIEEIHKRFSPLLLTVASLSVVSAQITVQILSSMGIGAVGLFHLAKINTLPIKLLFAPLLVGIVCGIGSIVFTLFYHRIDHAVHRLLEKVSVKILFPILFATASLVGFFLADSLGTGHSLVDKLFTTQTLWYVLLLVFLVRAILMMLANTAGVTGGIFLPTLAFGAILGSLCAEGMIALGWIGQEHYLLMVVLGISSFLGATSRIPVTACIFAVEALGGVYNIVGIMIATVVSFLVAEMSGLEDFTDTVIEAKVRAINKNKKPVSIEVPLTVRQNSFVVGKELHDILWPASCVVISYERPEGNKETAGLAEGDILTVHYKTYDPVAIADELELLLGDQPEVIDRIMGSAPDHQ